MPLRIFTNLASMNSQRILGFHNDQLGRNLSRIASGDRISKSADDAAGLAISETLRSDIRALRQGARNLNDGLALINVAEGALNEHANILIRLRELAAQSATGTIGPTERQSLQLEFNALLKEMDRIARVTEFNGQKLIDGSLAAGAPASLVLQIGIHADDPSRINLNQDMNLTEVTPQSLGLNNEDVLTPGNALQAMAVVKTAAQEVAAIRGRVGSVQNRLIRALNTLNISIENLAGAESAIRDTDVAEELALLTRNQILTQTGAAMVGQSNLLPQSVLDLLQTAPGAL